MTYKVVIPCAGLGTRAGRSSLFINKALLTVNHKPIICNIIDSFPSASEFVILLGYKGDYIRQVVLAFYPSANIRFVEVDKFEGPGSGLGYSLSKVKQYLQCPFVFISNDTLVPFDSCDINPQEYGNWVGYYSKQPADGFNLSQYRTINLKGERVTKINPKGVSSFNIYIGLCGIKDYTEFWATMESEDSILVGESYGLQTLPDITGIEFESWCDTGNEESFTKTKLKFPKSDINILDKDGESIWFDGNYVIKFSIDESFISDRVKRLDVLPQALFPKIVSFSKNLYKYKMIDGHVISDRLHTIDIHGMLDTFEKLLWNPTRANSECDIDMVSICRDFYQKKTYERVKLFLTKYEVVDSAQFINLEFVPKVITMLNSLDWHYICDNPCISMYHGDFHNENILITDSGEFKLLDWRQNFGKDNLHFGDIYYDFAKFYHGLIVSHGIVHNNQFSISESKTEVFFDILRPNSLVKAEIKFIDWLLTNKYDVHKVKILTALIFLNVAGLHEAPYSNFLFYLGKSLLFKTL